jgi:PAS domain-containing protein
MEIKDLEVFDEVPFLFWVKNENGTYLWGNRAICKLAGENVVGKTDRDLIWSDNANELQADDKKVFESGRPSYLHEYVDKSRQGTATLNVCKWIGEFENEKRCFGISFVIE